MKFTTLNDKIPYVIGGKEKILQMHPYENITLRMPGRHAKDTTPKGGDFVICVTSENVGWNEHQFTHTDLFKDVEEKAFKLNDLSNQLMASYLQIVHRDFDTSLLAYDPKGIPGIEPMLFLHAVQCLAVAEHRRYSQYESKFGGRYLPLRFAAGISEGLWTAADAASMQKKGRPGVEILEKLHGTPVLTKELING